MSVTQCRDSLSFVLAVIIRQKVSRNFRQLFYPLSRKTTVSKTSFSKLQQAFSVLRFASDDDKRSHYSGWTL